jgi:hypothetical protein
MRSAPTARRSLDLLLAGPWWIPFALGALALPAGSGAEIRPSTYVFVGTIGGTGTTPRDVSIAVDGSDRVLAVWTTNELGTLDVYGQTFDAAGAPVSSVFRVNPFSDGDEKSARAAGLPAGGFVVVWDDEPTRPGSIHGIQGIFVAAGGTTSGGFAVTNALSDLVQENPAISAARDGTFVVAWQADHDGSSGFEIVGRRLDAVGNPLTAELPVNATTAGDQTHPAVAAGGADGSFVVAWETAGGAGPAVSARRMAADGSPLLPQFDVSSLFGAGAGSVSAAIDNQDDEIYLWRDPSYATLRVRRFTPAGAGTYLAGPPAVGADLLSPCNQGLFAAPYDRLAVMYDLDASPGPDSSHVAELSALAPAAVAYDVAALTGNRCALGGNPLSGRFAAIYAVGTFLQFKLFDAGLPFADGFESGGLMGWSAAAP